MRDAIDKHLSSERVNAFNREYDDQYNKRKNADTIDRDLIDRTLFDKSKDTYVHVLPQIPTDDRLDWRARNEVRNLGKTTQKLIIV